MISTNPWQSFTWAVAVVSIIYYAVIAWKYYPDEIRGLLSKKRPKPAPPSERRLEVSADPDQSDELIDEQEEEKPSWQNEVFLEKAQDLLEYLTDEIREAHQKNYTKQDLVQMLQMILKEYSALKGTPFQFAVNNRIDAECAKYGLLHLGEGDKGEIWSMV